MKWLSVIFVMALPQLVSAQASGLVTCSGLDCNMCTFVAMINGLVNWLFSFLVLAAVLGLMIAGFKLVTSAGNESAWSGAKSMFTNIIIGFVIVLSAWLIVDTIMKAFIAPESGFGMWNQVPAGSCGGINESRPQFETEDEALDAVRENYQNVSDSFTGTFGSPEHMQFAKDCAAQGGKLARRVDNPKIVDCRTQ